MRRALLLTSQSIAPGLSKQCSGVLKAMQLESKSNAVGGSKHSSGALKAMLLEAQNIALAFAQHSCVSCAALLPKMCNTAAYKVPLCCVTNDTHLLKSVNDEVFIFLDDTNLMRAFDSHVIEGILIPIVTQRLYTDNLMPIAGTILVTAAEIPRG